MRKHPVPFLSTARLQQRHAGQNSAAHINVNRTLLQEASVRGYRRILSNFKAEESYAQVSHRIRLSKFEI